MTADQSMRTMAISTATPMSCVASASGENRTLSNIWLRVGPCYIRGRTACFACHETDLRAGAPLYDELVRQRRAAAQRGCPWAAHAAPT